MSTKKACKVPTGSHNDLTDEEAMEFKRQADELIKEVDAIVIPHVDDD
jgi:hypothetical protein